MHPEETASRYDRLAQWWQTRHQNSSYGIAQLERAIRFVKKKNLAIDIGCGSSGRFIKVLREYDFEVEGLDSSAEMIALAKQLHPDLVFFIRKIFANGVLLSTMIWLLLGIALFISH
jgi:trans-aconitate methyltransferase